MSAALRWGDVSDSDDEDISAFKEMNKPKQIVDQDDGTSRAPTKVLQRPKAKPSSSVNRTVGGNRNEKASNSSNRNNKGRDDSFSSGTKHYTQRNDNRSNENHSNWKQEAMKSRTIRSSRGSRENIVVDGNNWMQQRRKKQEENEREEMVQRQQLEKDEAGNREEKRKAQMEAMKAAVQVLKSERNVSDAPKKPERKPKKMRPKKDTYAVSEVLPTKWQKQKNGGVSLTKGETVRKITLLVSAPI